MTSDARIEAAVSALQDDGYAILEGLAPLGAMQDIAEELRPHFDAVAAADRRNATARIHSHVLAGAPVLQARMIEPAILAVLDRLLGPNCVRYQLSSLQGIEVFPGGTDQGLHRDDDIFRLPHPHPVFEVNVMWAVTDFTPENGATRVVPRSPFSGRQADPALDEDAEWVAAVAPAGPFGWTTVRTACSSLETRSGHGVRGSSMAQYRRECQQ